MFEPEPEPEPEIEPEPIPEPEPEPEPAFEPAAMEAEAEAEESQPAPARQEPESPTLSDEEIEKLMAGEPEPAVMESLVDSERADESSIDPEDIPDPEPIPGVFTATDATRDDEEGGGRKGLWITLIAVVLLAGVGSWLFMSKKTVVIYWPGAASIYSMLGIDAQRLGGGLELVDLRNEWVTQGGQKDLVVSGVIANVSKQEQSIPMLRIEMRDAHDAVVQVYVYPPEKSRLSAGDRLDFKAHVGEVMAMARRVHVLWTDEMPPEKEKAPAKPAS